MLFLFTCVLKCDKPVDKPITCLSTNILTVELLITEACQSADRVHKYNIFFFL